jgi:hypothetical protein
MPKEQGRRMNRPPDSPVQGYHNLIMAILHRAVRDAQGHCDASGHDSPARLEAEAQRWLADTQAVEDLLELAGFDASLVLRRLGPLLADAPQADNS